VLSHPESLGAIRAVLQQLLTSDRQRHIEAYDHDSSSEADGDGDADGDDTAAGAEKGEEVELSSKRADPGASAAPDTQGGEQASSHEDGSGSSRHRRQQ
jgi:hypothetical protein